MRPLVRPALEPLAQKKLDDRQAKLDAGGGSDPQKEWDDARRRPPLCSPEDSSSEQHEQKQGDEQPKSRGGRPPNPNKSEVIKKLLCMNRRSPYCMYCNYGKARTIEHFYPKASYPDKTFEWSNLFYICSDCNLDKGRTFELDEKQRPLCLNPEEEALRTHLKLILSTGRYASESEHGKHTIEALKLNMRSRPRERLRAYKDFEVRIKAFVRHKEEGNDAKAQEQLDVIREAIYQNVFEELYFLFHEQDIGLDAELVDAFNSYPELRPTLLTEELVSRFMCPDSMT